MTNSPSRAVLKLLRLKLLRLKLLRLKLLQLKLVLTVFFLGLAGNGLSLAQTGEKASMTDLPSLVCQITARSPQRLSEGVWVEFSVQSQAKIKLHFLPWHTPLEGLLGDLFAISDEQGESLEYQGPQVKRAAPTASDYYELQPGQVLKNRVDLALVYPFKANQAYQVRLRSRPVQLLGAELPAQNAAPCQSEPITIKTRSDPQRPSGSELVIADFQ